MSALLLISLLVMAPSSQLASAQHFTPVVARETAYRDSFGFIHIVAEIINRTQKPITNIKVKATLKDKDGALVGIHVFDPSPEYPKLTLQSQSAVGVHGIVFDAIESQKASTFDLNLQFDEGIIKERTLTITQSNFYSGDSGVWKVVGEIRNSGDMTARSTFIIVTLFEESTIHPEGMTEPVTLKKVVGVETIAVGDIESEESVPFSLTAQVPTSQIVGAVDIYAESTNSVVVPEFPLSATVILLGILGSIVCLNRSGYFHRVLP